MSVGITYRCPTCGRRLPPGDIAFREAPTCEHTGTIHDAKRVATMRPDTPDDDLPPAA